MSNDMPDVIYVWRDVSLCAYVAGEKQDDGDTKYYSESHVQQLIKEAEKRKVEEIFKGLESEDDSQQLRAIIASIKAILNAGGE